jgi:hypothetical protein
MGRVRRRARLEDLDDGCLLEVHLHVMHAHGAPRCSAGVHDALRARARAGAQAPHALARPLPRRARVPGAPCRALGSVHRFKRTRYCRVHLAGEQSQRSPSVHMEHACHLPAEEGGQAARSGAACSRSASGASRRIRGCGGWSRARRRPRTRPAAGAWRGATGAARTPPCAQRWPRAGAARAL